MLYLKIWDFTCDLSSNHERLGLFVSALLLVSFKFRLNYKVGDFVVAREVCEVDVERDGKDNKDVGKDGSEFTCLFKLIVLSTILRTKSQNLYDSEVAAFEVRLEDADNEADEVARG